MRTYHGCGAIPPLLRAVVGQGAKELARTPGPGGQAQASCRPCAIELAESAKRRRGGTSAERGREGGRGHSSQLARCRTMQRAEESGSRGPRLQSRIRVRGVIDRKSIASLASNEALSACAPKRGIRSECAAPSLCSKFKGASTIVCSPGSFVAAPEIAQARAKHGTGVASLGFSTTRVAVQCCATGLASPRPAQRSHGVHLGERARHNNLSIP
mmetsp:Transcript_22030/g.70350  ORF Transcript_22030/g.70350 Transcript_22030/m.70350 type:complete len:214 (+) Transcript_22030:262-903(+)